MNITCPLCNGTGVETDSNGVQRDEPCPECQGEGTVDDDEVPD